MNILFTICARKGSKGLKNKNISDFLNQPICFYTLSAYDLFTKKHPEYNCDLVLNTDSEELVKQFDGTNVKYVHITRTEVLAGDRVGKIDVIKDTFIKFGKNNDYIIDIDITSPLRTVGDIEGVFNVLKENESADLSFSVASSRRSPFFNQVKKNDDGFYNVVLPTGAVARQQVPSVYDMNASIYAYRKDFLLRAVKLFDGKALAYEMKDTGVLDIDNPEDKDLMEILAKYFYSKYPEFNEIVLNIENIKK